MMLYQCGFINYSSLSFNINTVSFYFYILKPKVLEDFKNTNLPLYNFLLNKWYIDELYEKVFVNPAKK